MIMPSRVVHSALGTLPCATLILGGRAQCSFHSQVSASHPVYLVSMDLPIRLWVYHSCISSPLVPGDGGKKYNLVTQPDLMRLRYMSKPVGVVCSIIGAIAILPWTILGMQALATVFHIASNGSWALPVCLIAGLIVIMIRQIWTVQMGMRGLIYTDMYQGLFAYVLAAIVCVFLLVSPSSPANWSMLSHMSDNLLKVPGDGGSYGPMYLFCQIFTGVVGALCWPMSLVRIYTAKDIRSVKKSTNYAIVIAGVFYALLTLTMLAAAHIPEVAANPQSGWTTLLNQYGGTWLLGLGLVMIFAGSIGHIDGSVQAAGTQIANDIIGSRMSLSDRQKTIFSKCCMVVFVLVSAVLAYFTNGMSRLQLPRSAFLSGNRADCRALILGNFLQIRKQIWCAVWHDLRLWNCCNSDSHLPGRYSGVGESDVRCGRFDRQLGGIYRRFPCDA